MRFVVATVVVVAVILTAFAALPTQAAARDAKRLDKATAARIISSMGYQNVTIGAVLEGVGEMGMGGSENTAVVLAVGIRNGQSQKIQQSYYYDADLGWFFFEYQDIAEGKHLVVWTASGVKSIRPAPPAK